MQAQNTRDISPLCLTEAMQEEPYKEKSPSIHATTTIPHLTESYEIPTMQSVELENQQLRATLRLITSEQFQRNRSSEECEQRNREMADGLRQIQKVLDILQKTLDGIFENI